MSTETKLSSQKDRQLAILDAGAQYAKVIDRRVRELNVESVIIPLDTPAAELKQYQGIIISGGPQSVYTDDAPAFDPELFSIGVPLLGICYGMQLLNFFHEGKVGPADLREDGQISITVNKACPVFTDLSTELQVLLTHGDSVLSIAPGFEVCATTANGIPAAIQDKKRNMYGLQFHPEVDLTLEGTAMFRNFLYNICKFKGSFNLANREVGAIASIRDAVGDNNVLVLVSGGVDSSVCAALLLKALGPDKVYGLHIDSGFMRHRESEMVGDALRSIGFTHLTIMDAKDDFFQGSTLIDGKQSDILCETCDPQSKRKIIGDTFMRVSNRALQAMGLSMDTTLLAQGTLRPDLIESASSHASANAKVIKTHHNDTDMVRALRDQGKIVEPLKDLHKDEVRVLGESLGLSNALVWRQPFPGPGLAIRIICALTPYHHPEEVKILAGLQAWSSESLHTTLLPTRTVGVQGDARSYSSLVGLTCTGKPDWPHLMDLAKQIPHQLRQVNRVVFVWGSLLPAALESITPTRLTPDVISILSRADDIVNQLLVEHKLTRKLSQVPVILFPVDFGETGKYGVCIRTFMTNDFMTGTPALPGRDVPLAVLDQMRTSILSEVSEVARVCYDLTAKPPGTTEWE